MNYLYKCLKCNKEVFVKFGSGKFCSRNCSNSRKQTIEINLKRSKTVNNTYSEKLQNKITSYLDNPKFCLVCNSIIPYSRRRSKSCSDDCKRQLLSISAKEHNLGGPNHTTPYGKKGIYKGFKCDSTYELAFLIYCLDNNILIERNKKSFDYEYKGKTYKYYPDFYLPETNTYVELKGRDLGPVYEKVAAMNKLNVNYRLYHYDDLIEIFNYITSKYPVFITRNTNNLDKLYDKKL